MYLLPVPKNLTEKDGFFTICYDSRIIVDSCAPAKAYGFARILQQQIRETIGASLPILRHHEQQPSNCIYITFLPKAAEQSYELSIEETHVTICGFGKPGILYGIQTLRQIIRQSGAVLPALSIFDSPSIPHRGFYFDTTRGRIPTLAYLKKLADTLSYYKLNQLQLYIEHSYLFRDLSEVWRDDTPLTSEDILELDRYCRSLQIELVPSLASFGHLYKLLSTKSYHHLCELEGSDTAPFSFHDRMSHHTIDSTNPESLELIKALLSEYMQLFTSRQFNICADETFDLGKGKSRQLAEQKGVTSVYTDFLRKIGEFILENGRTPMFWSDVICEEPDAINQLPEEMICLHWDYSPDVSEEQLKKLADAGAKKLYVCPGAQGWNHIINAHHKAYENISRMCRFGHKYHSMGVLTTDWGDFGHINHPDFSRLGMIYGAAFSWSESILPEEEINRQISILEYGDSTETICSVFKNLSQWEALPWYHTVRIMETLKNYKDTESAAAFLKELDASAVPEYNAAIDGQLHILYTLLQTVSPSAKSVIQAYLIAGEGQKLLNLLLTVLKHSLAGEPDQGAIPPAQLAVKLENWFAIYKELWRTTSKESELYHIADIFFWYADYLRTLSSGCQK